ncbi:hypothetical protein [Flavihumibacter sp. CACIAM 22H1]|uniref:hypothetical protein n=1 Tax=Flavihumibacter sp. CACIAM 22H1 TaxID=1812911 RepID=UPI0007A90B0C|nr:hypothetical protein [Flavihumibacter sp. CACIAM 22H1]KYP15676.1 MAG: hypothetical protein A1D16_19115 [Flavihumibacter sp. CACIAM 22H1]
MRRSAGIKTPILSALLLVVFVQYGTAQEAGKASFPKSWVGKWKGALTWHQGLQERPGVMMELHILPADSTDHYSWRIVYGTAQKDNRPYLLKPFNKERGHWLIDERNSIVLDQFLIGDRFCGTFTVEGNTILNSYQLSGDSLLVEFYNFQEKPIVITGGGDTTTPKIKTYGMRSHQRAVLRRF